MERLAERARAEGIRRFTAVLLSENRKSIQLFKSLGPAKLRAAEGVTELVVALP
jgi:L-amino acid N-acyltransferase YncA